MSDFGRRCEACLASIDRTSEQEVLLMLELERSDRAGLTGVSLGEVPEGGIGGAMMLSPRWWVGLPEMTAQVGLIAQPALEPAVGGGDGEREAVLMPDTVKCLSLGDSGDQCKQVCRSDAGVSSEMAPENGKSPPASLVAVAVRAKKRTRLTSLWWLWAR